MVVEVVVVFRVWEEFTSLHAGLHGMAGRWRGSATTGSGCARGVGGVGSWLGIRGMVAELGGCGSAAMAAVSGVG